MPLNSLKIIDKNSLCLGLQPLHQLLQLPLLRLKTLAAVAQGHALVGVGALKALAMLQRLRL